jgi:hypothetical protein
MKNDNIIFSIIQFGAAITLLIIGVILSFQGNTTNIVVFGAAFLCFILFYLEKFESFESFGIKAKVKQIEESVDTIISSSSTDAPDLQPDKISIEDLRRELGLRSDIEINLGVVIDNLKENRYSFRSFYGLANGTGLRLETVKEIVKQLYRIGYVNKAYSKSKGVLWTLSEKGKTIIPVNYIE